MLKLIAVSAVAAAMLLPQAAFAQRSLFDQTPANPSGDTAPVGTFARPSTPAASPAAATAPVSEPPVAAAKPKPKPKPKGPQPPKALTIVNGSSLVVVGVTIMAEGKSVTSTSALAPQGKSVVKLPPLKSCKVTVEATFAGEGQGVPGEVDICKDKTIRLTD